MAVAGCKGTSPVKATTPPKVTAGTTDLISKARLTGTVKLLAGLGAGVVSNNAGSVLSDNGLGVNGGGVLSDNGLGLISKARYAVAATPDENLLAEAMVEVLDAAGKPVLDAQGKPVVTTTNRQGAYTLEAALPAGPLVLRVKLFPNGGPAAAGGELLALVPSVQAHEAPIDTATSLAAAYVLQRYVQGQAAVLAKLPAADATALVGQLEGQRAAVGTPSYHRDALTATVQDLRGKVPALDQTLVRIEALLLAGQANRGDGLPATQVALVGPRVLALDGKRLLVAEAFGRIRGFDLGTPDAPIQRVAGSKGATEDGTALQARLASITAMVREPDGAIVVADDNGGALRRITPDGRIATLAPKGGSWRSPHALALAGDGGLLVGEAPRSATEAGRLWHMDRDGNLVEQDVTGLNHPRFLALEVGPDGTRYAYEDSDGAVMKQAPGKPWTKLLGGLSSGKMGGMLLAPDGTLLVSNTNGNQVLRVATDGTSSVVAGTGTNGDAGDGGNAPSAALSLPAGLQLGRDGTLYVADTGNGLVRAIAPDHTIRTVAGSRAVQTSGDAKLIPVSSPVSLLLDPQRRLVVVQSLAGVIKRLDGTALTPIAGAGAGLDGEDVPALQARFNAPTGATYMGKDLVVADPGNRRIRRVGADGKVTTLVRYAGAVVSGRSYPAADMPLTRPFGLATGPDGLLYWTDNQTSQLWRLKPDGQCELLAGSPAGKPGDAGDGGPAADALFTTPGGIAFSPDGRYLYVADSGNLKVRRIDMTDRTITTVAGTGLTASLAVLSGGWTPGNGTNPELALPVGVAVDAKGALYIAEAGTGYISATAGDANVGPIAEVLGSLPLVPPRIRVLGPDGKLSTLVGPGGKVLTDPNAEDALGGPCALAFDADGHLVLGDVSQDRLLILTGS
jgi:sugar lactone lactonase YvrE